MKYDKGDAEVKITLSEIYKAMIDQEVPINFNNTINSLEYCKTEIELKEKYHMKTSEFKNELRKMGYTFEGNHVMNEQNLAMAWISLVCVNMIVTTYGREVSPKLFSLITKYAATPIAEREDEPKLFNVQIIKGNWGRASWLYRYYDDVLTSSSSGNNNLNQQWTLEQIKEYGIDDETVYKRVPVEGM